MRFWQPGAGTAEVVFHEKTLANIYLFFLFYTNPYINLSWFRTQLLESLYHHYIITFFFFFFTFGQIQSDGDTNLGDPPGNCTDCTHPLYCLLVKPPYFKI